MNKVRILGIVILLIGASEMYFCENDLIDFIAGTFVGAGFIFTLTGRIAIGNTNIH